MFPVGSQYFFSARSEAGTGLVTIAVDVRPPAGEEWILQKLGFFANLAAGTYGTWIMVGPEGESALGDVAIAAQADMVWFNELWEEDGKTSTPKGLFSFPVKFTHENYVRAQIVNLAAGKYIYVKGLFLRRPENFELQFLKGLAEKLGIPFHYPSPTRGSAGFYF